MSYLQSYRSSKDILQLQLLLSYLQNGITDEYQKIPSLTAIFSAEASFILLDPSHNSFQVVSKFLMHSPRVDFKVFHMHRMTFIYSFDAFIAAVSWLIMLDNINVLYLLHLQDVPLFQSSLASNSIHFKANFLWILKLLYLGVNFDDDARIFTRKHLFELLLSVYVSSLSDSETKVLILQVI